MGVQLNHLMLPDAPDITLVAHGNIAVVAAQHHLCALGDDVTGAVNAGVDGGFGTAVADGFDFLDGVCHFHQPQAAGEQLGLEIRPQTEAHHRDIVFIHNAAQLVDLRRGEELAFVHNNYIAFAQPLLPEQRLQIPLRGNGLLAVIVPSSAFMYR